MIDKIDHAFERVFLSFVHDLEYERSDDVKALAIAHRFVVASVGKQNTFEKRSIAVVLVGSAAKSRTARSMQIFDDLHAKLIVVWIGTFVKGDTTNARPVQI